MEGKKLTPEQLNGIVRWCKTKQLNYRLMDGQVLLNGKRHTFTIGTINDIQHVFGYRGIQLFLGQPSLTECEKWVNDGIAKTPCECQVEPDGICTHGMESWLIILGYC